MKIEHEFQNTKNIKKGLGLSQTLSLDQSRLEILLLISAIAMLYLWLIGLTAERRSLHYHYQVNSIKTRSVLSRIFFGLQVVEHQPNLIIFTELNSTLQYVQSNEENAYLYN